MRPRASCIYTLEITRGGVITITYISVAMENKWSIPVFTGRT